jgi:hypothetical protein
MPRSSGFRRGRHGDATVNRFAALTPGARVALFAGAAHMPPWDAPEENVRVLGDFLRWVDEGGRCRRSRAGRDRHRRERHG